MREVFLDTSGLCAVANRRDQWHTAANHIWRELLSSRRSLVTTNLEFIEIGDGLSRLHERGIALQVRDALRRRVKTVHVTQAIEVAGWRLFSERMDKEWGVTDCISMSVMRERDIEEVFSFDRHFEQAGFRLLAAPAGH